MLARVWLIKDTNDSFAITLLEKTSTWCRNLCTMTKTRVLKTMVATPCGILDLYCVTLSTCKSEIYAQT